MRKSFEGLPLEKPFKKYTLRLHLLEGLLSIEEFSNVYRRSSLQRQTFKFILNKNTFLKTYMEKILSKVSCGNKAI